MKKFILPILFFSAVLFTGCSVKNEPQPTYISLVGTVSNPLDNYLFTINGDDGTCLNIVATDLTSFTPVDGQRLLAYGYLLDDSQLNSPLKTLDIHLVYAYPFPTQYLIPATKAALDSVGSDPVSGMQMYIAKNLLTVQFNFFYNVNYHSFNMLRDSLIDSNSQDTIKLEFRHNAHADLYYASVSQIISFDITELRQYSANPDSVTLAVSWLDGVYNQTKNQYLTYKF